MQDALDRQIAAFSPATPNQTASALWQDFPSSRALVDAFDDAALVFDHQGLFVYGNPAAHALLGAFEPPVPGQPLTLLDRCSLTEQAALIPPGQRPLTRALAGEVLPWRRFYLHPSPDVSPLALHLVARPLQAQAGESAQFALIRLRDLDTAPEPTPERQAPDEVAAIMASEAQLRQERDQILVTLNAFPAILFSIDHLGGFQLYNRALCQVTGYTPDDIEHMTVLDLFSGRPREEINQAIERAFETRASFDLDVPLITQAGDQVPVTLYGALAWHGTEPVLTVVALDISAVRDTLRASAISEERLSRSQAFANIGLWDWNLRSDEVYWSDRVAELIGTTNSRMRSGFQEFLSAAHPLDRPRLATSIENCVKGHDVLDEEFRVQRPDGTLRWMLARANLIHDDPGQAVRMLGVVQDITPLKHAEFVEKRAREQIQSIIDSLEARICVVDEHGEIIAMNRAWQRHPYRLPEYGLSLASGGDYLGYCDQLAAEGRTDWARLGCAVRNVLEGATASEETEISVQRGTREEIHLIRITPLRGATEAHPCVVINHQDVTKRRQIEQDLRQAKDDAERASRAKSEFLSLMSHELRTPMNAVLGFAQLLEQDEALNQEQLDSIGEILRAGHHLLQLINEVLDLARVESGSIDLALEVVPLDELAAECWPLIHMSARQHQVEVILETGKPLAVVADRMRLKQVLLNLLTNAIKYNRAGGQVRLEMQRIAQHPQRICVQITDTGLGIAPEDIEGLFTPFSRLERDTHREGTGIGLTVCRRLVEAMGGEIHVTSELGKGSCFWLDLEAAEHAQLSMVDGEAVAPASDVAERSSSPSLPESVKCILQIEDNLSNLKLIEQMLTRYPRLRLFNATDGAEGIELARREQPDVILLDIHMPGLNGYQVLEALRAAPATRAIPVIAVTANATTEDIAQGQAAGFDAYLTKPIAFPTLIDSIRQVVNS